MTKMRAIVAISLLLIVLQVFADPPSNTANESDTSYQTLCGITGSKPVKSKALSFCNKFNDESCCLPSSDSDANDLFDNLFSVGLSCRIRGDIRFHPLAKFGCLLCDPMQPRYTRLEPYTPLKKNCPTPNLQDNSKTYPAETNSYARQLTILVNRDWALSSFNQPTPLSIFGECGLNVNAPCTDIFGNKIPSRDPYTCGGNLMLPLHWSTDDNGGALTPAKQVEAFLNQDNIGPIHLSDDYAFRLIDSDGSSAGCRLCNDSETNRSNNCALPSCLMTQAQLLNRGTIDSYNCSGTFNASVGLVKYINNTAFVDEKCFSSAHPVTLSVMLVLSLVALFMLFL